MFFLNIYWLFCEDCGIIKLLFGWIFCKFCKFCKFCILTFTEIMWLFYVSIIKLFDCLLVKICGCCCWVFLTKPNVKFFWFILTAIFDVLFSILFGEVMVPVEGIFMLLQGCNVDFLYPWCPQWSFYCMLLLLYCVWYLLLPVLLLVLVIL